MTERERERERGRVRVRGRVRERGETNSLLMFVMNLNIKEPYHMNFTSNHQNMSELLIPQTTFHSFYITVYVIPNVNIYCIYIFAIEGRKDDFRSVFDGETCLFLTDKSYFGLLLFYFSN